MEIFIGIDPSLNSSGICIQFYENNIKKKEQFFIIKADKLTKKEKLAQESLLWFDYVLYDKTDLTIYKDYTEFEEYYKTKNIIEIADTIERVINDALPCDGQLTIYIVQEGISYGSSCRTKSVFDLAGLNYLIRNEFINKDNKFCYTISAPKHIKKFATGNGNASKDEMINGFKITHPELEVIPKIDDLADAYYMANYAKSIYDSNN